jgi:acetylornithine deacetylase
VDEVVNQVRGLLGEREGSVRPRFARSPLETTVDEPIVQALSRSTRDVLGREPELVGVPFWTDAALLADAGIPTVVFGPAGDGAHADVEWVDLVSVERCYEALVATAADFCA